MKRTCKTCNWSRESLPGQQELNENGRYCVKKPPVTVMVPSRNSLTGEMAMTVNSIFPPVSVDWDCGDWGQKMVDLVSGPSPSHIPTELIDQMQRRYLIDVPKGSE